MKKRHHTAAAIIPKSMPRTATPPHLHVPNPLPSSCTSPCAHAYLCVVPAPPGVLHVVCCSSNARIARPQQHTVKDVAIVSGPQLKRNASNGCQQLQGVVHLEVGWVGYLPLLPGALRSGETQHTHQHTKQRQHSCMMTVLTRSYPGKGRRDCHSHLLGAYCSPSAAA